MKPVAIKKVSREIREFIFAELNKSKRKKGLNPEAEKVFYVGIADAYENLLWCEKEGLVPEFIHALKPVAIQKAENIETIEDRQTSHTYLWRMFVQIIVRGDEARVEISMFSAPVVR